MMTRFATVRLRLLNLVDYRSTYTMELMIMLDETTFNDVAE